MSCVPWNVSSEPLFRGQTTHTHTHTVFFNPLNAELNPISHLLALLGAHHIFHVSGLRVNWFSITAQVLRAPMTLGTGRSRWQKLPPPTWLYDIVSVTPWRVNSTVFTCVRLCSFVSTWLSHPCRFLPVSRSTSERQKCVFTPGRVSSPWMTPVPWLVKEFVAFMKPAASTTWPQEPSIFLYSEPD